LKSRGAIAATGPQAADCVDELGKVVLEGGGDDGVVGVEVPAREEVAHSGDVLRRLRSQPPRVDRLHRRSDLDEAHSHCRLDRRRRRLER
jgi:hypothetical protein